MSTTATIQTFLATNGLNLALTSDGDYAVIARGGRIVAQGATVEAAVRRAKKALRSASLA